jgi:hypothetical protein
MVITSAKILYYLIKWMNWNKATPTTTVQFLKMLLSTRNIHYMKTKMAWKRRNHFLMNMMIIVLYASFKEIYGCAPVASGHSTNSALKWL